MQCKWSLRAATNPPNLTTPWTPRKTTIVDNQEVQLFCHSFGAGTFVKDRPPPVWAPALYAGSSNNALQVPILEPVKLNPTYNSLPRIRDNHRSIPAGRALAGVEMDPSKYNLKEFTQQMLRANSALFDTSRPEAAVLGKSFAELLAMVRDYDSGRATPSVVGMLNFLNHVMAMGRLEAHDWPRSFMNVTPEDVQSLPHAGLKKEAEFFDIISWNLPAWVLEDEMQGKDVWTFRIRFDD